MIISEKKRLTSTSVENGRKTIMMIMMIMVIMMINVFTEMLLV